MRFTRTLAASILLSLSGISPTFAFDDLERMTLATSLGNVLASEAVCGLAFDQEAITRYIEQHVPENDMEFPNMLSLMTDGATYQIGEMSGSAKTAHCAQIRRLAKSTGFTK